MSVDKVIKKVLTSLTMKNQSLTQVMESNYSGVVLTEHLSCAKNVERAKLAFFKQLNPKYYKFSFVDKATSFTVLTT